MSRVPMTLVGPGPRPDLGFRDTRPDRDPTEFSESGVNGQTSELETPGQVTTQNNLTQATTPAPVSGNK